MGDTEMPRDVSAVTYQVSEIFDSIQGEGALAGRPSTFVRLQGCTVGCSWCDTKYAWPLDGGTKMTVAEIFEQVHRPHIVITGGEPLLQDLDALLQSVGWDLITQVETTGFWDFKGTLRPDWLTISPKANLGFVIHPPLLDIVREIKWVVDEALTEKDVLRYGETDRWYTILMPEGCPPRPEMVKKTLEWLDRHPSWWYGDRLQYRIGVR
jgi:7-carboxy-7-deazaguanine synthase